MNKQQLRSLAAVALLVLLALPSFAFANSPVALFDERMD